ncbi:diguanylate cyclase [Kineosporia sp. R_H_3]|uniref:GGDEF domain-containing protein n=1 Tax=Kineosporia sp. R_H_3 TaxID=1961848 RepID=UPI000B4BFE8B|nr:GGDEF domain-containing protein [Kineosporia sp. R_H_3]
MSVQPRGRADALADDLPDDLPEDRYEAWVASHLALENLQILRDQGPTVVRLERWAEQAERRGWPEVHVQLLDCRLLSAALAEAGPQEIRDRADALLAAATRSDDEVLLARAIACRVQNLVASGQPGSLAEDFPGEVARAVAMLDDAMRAGPAALGARAAELPAAYVECGLAYYRYELWELEAEMYDRAERACALPLDDALQVVVDLTRKIIPMNRQENDCTLVCALLEVGRDEDARDVARRRPAAAPAPRGRLPELWQLEIAAQDHLLTVVAAGPDAPEEACEVPAGLYEALGRSTWRGYRGLLHLAAALARRARGDLVGAAAEATLAVERFDGYGPTPRNLALGLAALGTPESPAHRYARHLVGLRWDARLHVLAAARARLVAAGTLRDGEALRRQLLTDELTRLGSRRAWTQALEELRADGDAGRVAVVLLDLDAFKQVNDTFGHTVGDKVLRVVGALLADAARGDDLVVRLGGDEFALLARPDGTDDLSGRAREMVDALRRHDWEPLAAGLRVTASAGHASGPADAVDTLLATADARLYAAKAAGRDRAYTQAT